MSESAASAVQTWLVEFEGALTGADRDRLAGSFATDAYWRDLVALTWDIGWVHAATEIADALLEANEHERTTGWAIDLDRTAPRVLVRSGVEVIEAFISFETRVGPAVGILRLLSSNPTKARLLVTRLADVHDGPTLVRDGRPADVGYDRSALRGWLQERVEAADFETRDLDVLVVGGGHSGVFTAANLNRLGVATLVVDRLPRIGDNWRTRYDSLALHNPTDMVHFPYMPFPDTFPEYLPKDRLANWFESYVDAMEINYWTSTDFRGGRYDQATRRWSVTVVRDGREVQLSPRHIVVASGGVGGPPNIPQLPGIDDFDGDVLHTSQFGSSTAYADRNVLVVGVGSSGHDVALDLTLRGANVTMLQRNPTSVVDLDSANLSYQFYVDGTPLEEADLISSAGFIHPLMLENFRASTQNTNRLDSDMLAGLRAAGLRIDDGEHGAGWLLKFYQRGGGYYINVGASQRIINGDIAILQSEDVDHFEQGGVRLADGSHQDFSTVVLATGFRDQQVELRRYFGDDVADRVGSVAGFDDDGELRNAWRPTGQDGLWIMVSGFAPARNHSRLVALQIRADLDGVRRTPRRLRQRAVASVNA